jgi:hypothetical protein
LPDRADGAAEPDAADAADAPHAVDASDAADATRAGDVAEAADDARAGEDGGATGHGGAAGDRRTARNRGAADHGGATRHRSAADDGDAARDCGAAYDGGALGCHERQGSGRSLWAGASYCAGGAEVGGDSLGLFRELAPGHAQHAVAAQLEVGIPAAVCLECGAGGVDVIAINLDDKSLLAWGRRAFLTSWRSRRSPLERVKAVSSWRLFSARLSLGGGGNG